MNLVPNGNGIVNLKFHHNFIHNCNDMSMGMKANKKLINVSVTNNIFVNAQKAIALRGQSKQYVNLRITGNQGIKF